MIISVVNNKGGIGKTTTAFNIGAGLAKKGRKILLVDLDSQANLTSCFGIDENNDSNIGSLLDGSKYLPDVIHQLDLLDIIPGSTEMKTLERRLAGKTLVEMILSRKLEKMKSQYDYIILDCPPSLGLMTNSALYASEYYIIPIQAEFFAYKGINKMIEHVDQLRDETDINVQLLGILLIKYNPKQRGALKESIAGKIKEGRAEDLFNATIRQNKDLIESPVFKKNVFDYAPESAGAEDYRNLVDEIEHRILVYNDKKIIS